MVEIKEVKDIDEMMRWRLEVIAEVFGTTADADLSEANRNYYLRHIADGTHQAFVAQCDGTDAGSGAVCFHDELPSPDNHSGQCAYIMNVYVRSDFRRKGIASAMVRHLVAVAVARGYEKIYLESTDSAVPLYRDSGFVKMDNMMSYVSKND